MLIDCGWKRGFCMLFKKGLLWGALCLCLIPLVYASGLLSPIKPDDLREVARGRYNLISLMIGCEMDNKCMQLTLTELIKNDPHPLYEEYLYKLNKNKDQIELEREKCYTLAHRAYNREIAACLKEILNVVDAKEGINYVTKEKVEKPLNECLAQRIDKLARSGNIYAQSLLMNRALDTKNQPTFDYWYNEIQKLRTTGEYEHYRACQPSVEMFEILSK